jgi:hypothetical protein
VSNRIDYSHKLLIPPVEGIHQALAAFLQTSDQGRWSIDDQETSTPFAMLFRRGSWQVQAKWFGGATTLSPLTGEPDGLGGVMSRTKPMRLEVTVRPSPDDIQIGLRHSVCYPEHAYQVMSIAERREYWLPVIEAEVSELRAYLRKFYQFDVLPSLEPDPIDANRAAGKAEVEQTKNDAMSAMQSERLRLKNGQDTPPQAVIVAAILLGLFVFFCALMAFVNDPPGQAARRPEAASGQIPYDPRFIRGH